MKYEPVFGNQSLFFDAQKDCEMVGNGHHKVENGKLMVWNFIEKRWCNSHTNTITISAMRRIIAEPKRWTVADQKAGRLPEVGCLVVNKTGKVSEVVTIKNGYFVLFECGKNNGPLTIHGDLLMNQFKPVETPEEKAQRLREEWCIKALSSCSILSGMQKYELKRLGGYIEDIYDALLSGELTMPSKDGE